MTDLLSELRAATYAVRQVHLDRLRTLGVSVTWLASAAYHQPFAHLGFEPSPLPGFGVSLCEPIGNDLYLPGQGEPHLILPVIERGGLVDLCGFRASSPDKWMLRRGNGFALGLDRGLDPWLWYRPADLSAKPAKYQVGQPTTLYSDPLDWLRGQGEGICVLDWESPEIRQLDVLAEVTCSTPQLARLFRGALTRPIHTPKISIMEMRNAA